MKETFYFPHDYNAFNDERIVKLRRKLGLEGYGVYWCLIEKLASSSEARLKLEDLEDIAFDMHVECGCITSVVKDFELFKTTDTHFWSTRLLNHFREREEKSKLGKLAAKARWSKESQGNADALPTQCDPNAIKERKGKERKDISTNVDNESVEKVDPVYGKKHLNDLQAYLLKELKLANFMDTNAKKRQYLNHLYNYIKKQNNPQKWLNKAMKKIKAENFEIRKLETLYRTIKTYIIK